MGMSSRLTAAERREQNRSRRRRFELLSACRAWVACAVCGSGAIEQRPRALLRCRTCGNEASRVGGNWFKLVRQRHRTADLKRHFPA